MKKTYNKLTCLFGFHDYSKEVTIDKYGNRIHFCKVCKRIGYWCIKGRKRRTLYDEEGNPIYDKWDSGEEYWCVNGRWTSKKPEDWKYDI